MHMPKPVKLQVGIASDPELRTILEQESGRLFAPMKRFVEGGPEVRLGWLLNFCQLPYDEIEARWENELSYHAVAFCQAVVNAPDVYRAKLIPKDELLAAVKHVGIGLRQLTLGLSWKFDLAINATISYDWIGHGFSVSHGADDFVMAFFLAVSKTIEESGTKIRKCKRRDCNTLFLKTRRTEYCSPRCGQTERMRTYRKNKGTQPAEAKAKRRA